MRIALISDIHGNLVALDAVLQAIEALSPHKLICLGDVAATGPQPREALARLRDLSIPVVKGNTDDDLLDAALPEDGAARMFVEIDAWCRDQLRAEDLDFIRTFQPRLEIALDDEHTLLCFHGSPISNRDVILAHTPQSEVDDMLGDHSASLLAGGHTHRTLFKPHRDMLLINPGSVGLPYVVDGDEVWNPPWAEYALIDWQDGQPAVSFRRAPLDAHRVTQAAVESGMPHARRWASGWR